MPDEVTAQDGNPVRVGTHVRDAHGNTGPVTRIQDDGKYVFVRFPDGVKARARLKLEVVSASTTPATPASTTKTKVPTVSFPAKEFPPPLEIIKTIEQAEKAGWEVSINPSGTMKFGYHKVDDAVWDVSYSLTLRKPQFSMRFSWWRTNTDLLSTVAAPNDKWYRDRGANFYAVHSTETDFDGEPKHCRNGLQTSKALKIIDATDAALDEWRLWVTRDGKYKDEEW